MADEELGPARIDEADTSRESEEFFALQADRLAGKFGARRINFHACADKASAAGRVVSLVEEARRGDAALRVGFADSVSLHQLGIHQLVKDLPNTEVVDPFERFPDGKYRVYGKLPPGKMDLPKDEYYALMEKLLDRMRESLMTDVFITGANAITMRGQIVSTDGTGNRVAGMIFGPRKVIVVVGTNKVVDTVDDAVKRNRNVAAPLNYLRHNIKHHNRFDTPCLTTGVCSDCNHRRRGCLNTVIIDGAMEAHKDRIHLVLVNEHLGF